MSFWGFRYTQPSSHVFMTERDGPMTPKAFHALFGRIGARAKMQFLVHPHMLRHGCGYALANAGHDTRALQAWLGHKNIQHTVRYTELAPDRFKHFWRWSLTASRGALSISHEFHVAAPRMSWSINASRLIRRSFGPDSSTKTTRLSRYGYRKVAALLRQAGWTINDKRVERILATQGKVPIGLPVASRRPAGNFDARLRWRVGGVGRPTMRADGGLARGS
jgi:hypothetical protein